MSKKAKAKAANRKRRKTILEATKAEANNYKALADQYGAESARAKELHAEAATETKRLIEKGARSTEEILRRGSVVNDLKKIIAGLERDVAERDGTIRELRRQIDQAAPKVMVQPAVFASPTEASNRPYIAGDREAFHRSFDNSLEAATKKHWTAL